MVNESEKGKKTLQKEMKRNKKKLCEFDLENNQFRNKINWFIRGKFR